jgi:hypothetical protein
MLPAYILEWYHRDRISAANPRAYCRIKHGRNPTATTHELQHVSNSNEKTLTSTFHHLMANKFLLEMLTFKH